MTRGRRQNRSRAAAARRQALTWPQLLYVLLVAGAAIWLLFGRQHWPTTEKKQPKTARELTMDEARRINAAIPFARGPLRAARPYRFRGSPAGRLQAQECLATAALYEAGQDSRGQKAVMQVILNRVRHPGFPKTVCGVVYQGSSRRTGCQFTFTCDGSFKRRRATSGWSSVRKAAKRALDGYVFAPVGRATHYHTDWVAPYWSGSMDKIAQVNTHLFFVTPRK